MVTWPMTFQWPKKKHCRQNGIMGFQNPNVGPKKHISMIAVIVFIADYFFLAAILEICKLAN